MLDHVEHLLRSDIAYVLDLLDHLIDRNRSDRHRGGVDDGLTNAIDVASRGQVHDRIGAQMNRGVEFSQFVVHLARDSRVSDIRIDLASGRYSDAHWLEVLRKMQN